MKEDEEVLTEEDLNEAIVEVACDADSDLNEDEKADV